MKKLLALIAFLWVMTACEKSGEDTPQNTQTQIPYDWDFYLKLANVLLIPQCQLLKVKDKR